MVISTGPAKDHLHEPAELIRGAGILLYVVGIRDTVRVELRETVSQPEDRVTSLFPASLVWAVSSRS